MLIFADIAEVSRGYYKGFPLIAQMKRTLIFADEKTADFADKKNVDVEDEN